MFTFSALRMYNCRNKYVNIITEVGLQNKVVINVTLYVLRGKHLSWLEGRSVPSNPT